MVLKDNVFTLNISSRSHDSSTHGGSHSHHQYPGSSNTESLVGSGGTPGVIPEILIHRRIIEMYNARDDFTIIDMHVDTCRTISKTTKVDIANALQHMKSKHKTLRRLKANIDYMDPSVHEFVLLNVLEFHEVVIESTPFEQTHISSGISIALRHSLTANQRCIRYLDLSCGISEESCGILSDALKQIQNQSTSNHVLEYFRLNLLAGNSRFVSSITEGLVGISTLQTLHLGNANGKDLGEPLKQVLSNSKCNIRELYLDCDDDYDEHFDTTEFMQQFHDTRCNSIIKFHTSGINYNYYITPPSQVTGQGGKDLKDLNEMFPNLQCLELESCNISKLAFLDEEMILSDNRARQQHFHAHSYSHRSLHHQPIQQQFQKLTTCSLKNCIIPIEEKRRLLQSIPYITTLHTTSTQTTAGGTTFTNEEQHVIDNHNNDPIVNHYLDWNRYGRVPLLQMNINNISINNPNNNMMMVIEETIWPIIFETVNLKFVEQTQPYTSSEEYTTAKRKRQQRCASLNYCLMQDLITLRGSAGADSEDDDDDDDSTTSNKQVSLDDDEDDDVNGGGNNKYDDYDNSFFENSSPVIEEEGDY